MDPTSNSTSIYADEIFVWNGSAYEEVQGGDPGVSEEDMNDAIAAAIAPKANTTDVNSALALKAPLASPSFTGTVTGITQAMIGLGAVNNTSDANKPVSTATAAALALKANILTPQINDPMFVWRIRMMDDGGFETLTLNSTESSTMRTAMVFTHNVTLGGPTRAINFNGSSCNFTGSSVSGLALSAANVGLENCNNTSDLNKPISTATQTGLNAKQNTLSNVTGAGIVPILSGTVVRSLAITDDISVTQESNVITIGLKPQRALSTEAANNFSAINSALGLKAPLANPLFTTAMRLMLDLGAGPEPFTEFTYTGATIGSSLSCASTATIAGQLTCDGNVWIPNAGTYLTVRNIQPPPLASISMTGTLNLDGTTNVNGTITFASTVNGLTKSAVGLSNVDNTSARPNPYRRQQARRWP